MMIRIHMQLKEDKGVALVTVLLFLVVMAVLSTALTLTVQNEMRSSSSYKYSQQAFYVANAGIQRAIDWFINSYEVDCSSNPCNDYDKATLPVSYSQSSVVLAGQTGLSSVYPDQSTITSFTNTFRNVTLQANSMNSGVYEVNATLLKHAIGNFIDLSTFETRPKAIQRWRIESIGYWGNRDNPLGMAKITATIENSGNSLFDKALWGIDMVDLGGTTLIDSYDPRLGLYGGTNIGNNGSVGTNGSVSASNNVDIFGDVVYYGSASVPDGVIKGGGELIHLTEPRYFPPLPDFSVGSSDVSVKPGKSQSISPGKYKDIDVKGTLTFAPGVYYIDSLKVTSNGKIEISDSTTLYIKSALTLTGQGISNSSLDPTKLTIYYRGTQEAKMTGGSQAYVEVYAPNAPVVLEGNSNFFGTFIGKTVKATGTPDIHFSEGSLNDHLLHRNFRVITWSQDVY